MKKILTILAVALLATATVFAGVSFSGSATAGVAVNHNEAWSVLYYGDDGEDTAAASLKLRAADDNGLWSLNFNSTGNFDSSGKWGADLTINLSKALGEDFPVGIELSTTYLDRYTTLRAYANKSGNNLDRARTIGGTTHFAAKVSYENYITLAGSWNGNVGDPNVLTVSALTNPIPGLTASVAYVYGGGENKVGDWGIDADARTKTISYVPKDKKDPVEGSYEIANVTNMIQGAVDINFGTLFDLGFDLGASVSDRYQFGGDIGSFKYPEGSSKQTPTPEGDSDTISYEYSSLNTLAVVLYGGYDMIDAYVEYGLHTYGKVESKSILELGVGVDLNVVKIKAWFGTNSFENFGNNLFVGGSVGGDFGGVGYKLAVEYAGANNNEFGAYSEYDNAGITITPSVSVSF